ncbi:MAG: hypothetical protein JWQ04_2252 [Pedosphaera sp.]|nr:hypothetical protein [Pedosphaera sp.]
MELVCLGDGAGRLHRESETNANRGAKSLMAEKVKKGYVEQNG